MNREYMNTTRKDNLVQRLVAMVLCLLMCFQLLPVTAMAAGGNIEELRREKENAWAGLKGYVTDGLPNYYDGQQNEADHYWLLWSQRYKNALVAYYDALGETAEGADSQEIEADIQKLDSLQSTWSNSLNSCRINNDFKTYLSRAFDAFMSDVKEILLNEQAERGDSGAKEKLMALMTVAINTLLRDSYGYTDEKTITALSNYVANYDTAVENYYSSLEDQKDAAMDSIVEEIEADIENVKSVQALWGDFTARNYWEVWNSLYFVTRNITNTLESLVVYLEDVKITIDLPAVMRDNVTTAWEALKTAHDAYQSALSTITDFRDAYRTKMKAYGSETDIYKASEDENNTATGNAKYAKMQGSFTWTEKGPDASPTDTKSHTDVEERYSSADAALKDNITEVKTTLGQMETLLTAYEAAFNAFYEKLPGEVTKGKLGEWQTIIESWEYNTNGVGSPVEVEGKYYSTQFPYYYFRKLVLDGPVLEDGITYTKSGLELAYYVDCDYSLCTDASLSLARTANEKLWGSGNSKIAAQTVAKLEQLVAEQQELDKMDEAREAVRQAWIKLSLVNPNSTEETPLSKAREGAKEYLADKAAYESGQSKYEPSEPYKYVGGLSSGEKDSSLTRIDSWTTAAGAYHLALCNYMESTETGPLSYYALEKLKALNAQYHQEFVAMTQEWKTAMEWANATPETADYKQRMQNYADVLEKYVTSYQSLTRQLDTMVAEGARVMASKTDLNPYDDDILDDMTNDKLGITKPNPTAADRTTAIRAYLRMQQMELTVWHDVAKESIATTRAALNLEDTTWQGADWYSRYFGDASDYLTPEVIYDLNEAIVEWTAYEAYTQFMLDNVNDVYELYEQVDTSSGGGSGSTTYGTYQAAKNAYDFARSEYEAAASATSRAKKDLDEHPNDITGDYLTTYENAQNTEGTKRKEMEAALAAMYDAAVKYGNNLLTGNYLNWEQSYYDAQKTAAFDTLTAASDTSLAKTEALDDARNALSTKENDLWEKNIAKIDAMANYSNLVTQLIEAKANLVQAEKDKGKTNLTAEQKAAANAKYKAALASYTEIDARAATASDLLTEASSAYNAAGKARDAAKASVTDAQKALDEANVAVAAARDEYDRWSELANGTDVKAAKQYIDPVPLVEPGEGARYSVASLELQIEESNQIIESSQAKVQELYEIMDSATFTDLGAEKCGEIIFEFRCNVALRAGHLARKASLEEAMASQYHPMTLDGARAAARNAVSDYYYAKRAYDEFALMESRLTAVFRQYDPKNGYMNFLRGGENSSTYSGRGDDDLSELTKYGFKLIDDSGFYSYSNGYMGSRDEPEVHAMLLAGQKVYGNYETRLSELQSAMDAAKAVMDQKLTELNDQEIAYEKKLTTEGAILQRQAMLKVAYEAAEKNWNGTNKNGPNYTEQEHRYSIVTNDVLSITSGTGYYYGVIEDVCMDLANYMWTSEVKGKTLEQVKSLIHYEDLGALNDAINAGWTHTIEANTFENTMRSWLNTYGSAGYYTSYVEYTLADAVYKDEGGKRTELLNRVRKMGDQYAMQVNTQATSGSGILFFAVVYYDEDGFERKEYIFPFLDAYKNTITEAGKTLAGAWEAANGNVIDPTSTENVINQEHIETMQKLGQAGSIKAVTALSPWSSDIFLFRTQYKMGTHNFGDVNTENFDHFEMFVERQNFKKDGKVDLSKKNEWSCASMKLYKVDNFYGMSVYGYGGGPQTYTQLEFKGRLLGYLEKKLSASIAWVTDDLIQLGGDNEDLFTVKHANTEYRTGKVSDDSGASTLQMVSDADSEYLIKLDFADAYGAGIEGLVNQVTDTSSWDTPVENFDSDSTVERHTIDPSQKVSFKDLGMTECLMLNLVYKDGTGTRRQVSLPVITSSAAWAMNNGLTGDEKIFGYAQQDNSVVFSAYLPEMKELSKAECTLTFKYVDWTGWKTYTKASQTVQSRIDGRKALIEADTGIDLAGIQIYAPGTYTASAKVEQGVVRYDVAAKGSAAGPAYMYTADRGTKITCANGVSLSLGDLIAYESDDKTPLSQVGVERKESMYMLVINTDEMELAGSESMPTVDLYYTTQSGRSEHRSSYVGADGLDFYGYWPGVNNSNVTVPQALGPGGQLKLFYKDMDNVATFDSVRINMPENLDDDWQIKGIYLVEVRNVGPRFAVWENIFKGEEFITDRRYDRTIDGTQMTQQITEPILLQPGDSKDIAFENAENPIVTATETDWNKVRYYMEYDEAQSALGFTKTRETYTVKVQVNDEGASTVSDGDCGSVNNFYFQLVFANGRSAYVLANQQLSGDGFRTGYIETFTINTNRDYGELQAVRIIPDDNSADSDLFDKLNIKRIKVSRNSDESVSRTWVVTDIGDNGWISFDYHDDAETYGILGRPGRSESELSVNCPVSYVTYSTKLLFALSTAPADDYDVLNTLEKMGEGLSDEERKKIEQVLTADVQYQGQLSMTLYYHNNKGGVEPMIIDVVGAMAAYANKVADKEETLDSQGNVITGSQYISNKEYMFRPGHTDRFEVDVSDVSDLVSVDLIATGVKTQSAFWKLSALSVSTLEGAGVLNLNTQNEYEKTNAQSGDCLCTAMGMPFTQWCPAANPEKMSFSFTENRLKVDEVASTWAVAPARVPESSNDTANIYVYAKDVSFNSTDEYNKLFTQLQYTNVYGQIYKAPLREMVQYKNHNVFFTAGVDIGNIAVLNNIMLTLNSNLNKVAVEKIVVQQIREGVVVSTYTMTPSGDFSEGWLDGATNKALILTPGDSNVSGTVYSTGADRQIVTVGFGKDTDPARLISVNRDVGIALKYTSVNDVKDATTNKKPEYVSPYIYLTDQDIVAISNGATAQLTFHEQYVDQVTGIVAVATGGLQANVTAVSVQMQEPAVTGTVTGYKDRDTNNWYSALPEGGAKLSIEKQTIPVATPDMAGSLKTVSPFTVTLITGLEVPTGDLTMLVYYKTDESSTTEEYVEFPNVRNNLVSGGFNANQSATFRVMLGKNAEVITKIELYPYNDGEKWAISNLKACLERTGQEIVVEEHRSATASEHAVFTPGAEQAKINLTVTATVTDVFGNVKRVNNQIGGAMVLNNVGPREEVSISASFSSTATGEVLNIMAESQSSNGWLDVSSNLTAVGTNQWTFVSKSGEDTVYRITLTPSLHPAKAVVLTVNYKGIPVEEEEAAQPEPEPEPEMEQN